MSEIRLSQARHILIVEDDASVRELSADILAEAGFKTREAACAAEAIALFQNPDFAKDIAAIVTDVDMPGELNGFALAAWVHESWPGIGIIITSGSPRGGAALCRHPDLFLPKPFRAERLVAAVQTVLDRGFALPPVSAPSFAIAADAAG
jgi:DNA-binding NtrC family response regulator